MLSESTLVFTQRAGAAGGRSIAACYGERRTRPLNLRDVYITEQRYGPVNVLIWWTADQEGERIRAVGTDLRGDGPGSCSRPRCLSPARPNRRSQR